MLLNLKALDKEGKIYDVKAIQDAGNDHVLDVKAFIGGKPVPVKVLVSDDRFAPVKAIGTDGTIYDVKALTADGTKLDVKGVSRSGSLFHIKAVGPNEELYGVKAISRAGHVYDVKGIKTTTERVEATVHGVSVEAHVKALPQARG
jgi:hypothetical protein